MKEQFVLVDFENVQKLDLARLPAQARIKVFIGAQQSSPAAILKAALERRQSIELLWIDGNGRNALDSHIACHLGEGLARTPQAEFVVVSRDTGFDPLLRHLKARGLQCRREAPATAAKAASKPKPVLDANAQEVIALLKRTEKNKRPRKRKTLTNYLVTHFQKKLTPEHVKAAIEQLVKAQLIGGTDTTLAYDF